MVSYTVIGLFIFLSSSRSYGNGENILKMVHLVYRHGDRTPVSTFPTDKYQESYWPDGFGQLTQLGMRLEYGLGKFLRERYIIGNKLVNTSYLHKEVYCRSSNKDRCLMSAESQMAGLYPPSGWQVWNPKIPWQPIPVHTVPPNEDPLIRPYGTQCPRLKGLTSKKMNAKTFIDKENENKPMLKLLSNRTGMTVTLANLWRVYDPLFVEKSHNLTLPKWLTAVLWEKMRNLYEWAFTYKFTGDVEFSRLSGGPLIKEIVGHMESMSKSLTKGLFKLNVYSGHDTSLMALLGGMGIPEVTIPSPPYASCVAIELYLLKTGRYAVQIIYRNDSSRDPYTLKLHKCNALCPLEKFVSLMKPRIPDNYKKECGVELPFGKSIVRYIHENMTLVIGLGLVIMLLVLIIVIMAVICNRRSNTKFRTISQKNWTMYDTEDEESDSSAILLKNQANSTHSPLT